MQRGLRLVLVINMFIARRMTMTLFVIVMLMIVLAMRHGIMRKGDNLAMFMAMQMSRGVPLRGVKQQQCERSQRKRGRRLPQLVWLA